jgi:DNA-binding protein HU-beta
MNLVDLAGKIAAEHGLTKNNAKTLITGVLKAIADNAVAGEETTLPGFGKFVVKNTPEREGRNPTTGEPVTIAAGKKLAFQPAKAIKELLNA